MVTKVLGLFFKDKAISKMLKGVRYLVGSMALKS